MYTLDINTSKYDIKLLVAKFGKKSGKSLGKTAKKTDIGRVMKRMNKTFSHFDTERLQIPV
jgi:hypothetical protein